MASDVKWIKITTDIFDDEKTLMIESMPAADSIIVIWFKLLTFAGKQNNDGVFMMSNRIAYTDEMLASIFRRDVKVVRLALDVFRQFGMIEIIEDVITIPNWNKHQTLDAYEKKKERDRLYQQERRAAQRALIAQSSDISSDSKAIPSSDVVVSEEDREIDIEIDLDNKDIIPDSDEPEPPAPNEPKKPKKQKKPKEPEEPKCEYGEYKHVLLTDTEYEKLAKDFGSDMRDKAIVFLDEYMEEKKKYKSQSHYLAIRRWVIDAVKEREEKQNRGRKEIVPSWMNKGSFNNFNQRQYDTSEMSDIERKMLQKKTAGNSPDIAARAEALKKQLS